MSSHEPWTVALAESGQLPDSVIRFGIRRLLRGRLAEQAADNPFLAAEQLTSFAGALREAPIALRPERANGEAFLHFFCHRDVAYSYEGVDRLWSEMGGGI